MREHPQANILISVFLEKRVKRPQFHCVQNLDVRLENYAYI